MQPIKEITKNITKTILYRFGSAFVLNFKIINFEVALQRQKTLESFTSARYFCSCTQKLNLNITNLFKLFALVFLNRTCFEYNFFFNQGKSKAEFKIKQFFLTKKQRYEYTLTLYFTAN